MKKSELLLQVANLCIRRGSTVILSDVSWEVRRGEHWVILGANGSGKTSLLSALTGYLTPSEGDIELLGQKFGETDWRELRKNIGIVSSSIRQMMADPEPALISVASGKFAMIDFWGDPSAHDLRLARKILRQVECEHIADRPWAVLSQGERQRVLIGRALMAKPAVLILDEPCAGLDPVAREHFLRFIDRLASQRHSPALIFVTHHVEEIRPVFSHVLMIREGRVLVAGSRSEVLNSRTLSKTFDAPIRLKRARDGFGLKIRTDAW